jgi:hypothetical protein
MAKRSGNRSDNDSQRTGDQHDTTPRQENQNAADDAARKEDIHDSPRDRERLEPDEATMNLPDVKDIPGQEFVHVPRMGELGDNTISSDDEEGRGVFDDDPADDTLMSMGNESDVPREEKAALEGTEDVQNTSDDNDLRRTSLDTRDEEGARLNESFDRTGGDLDVPGAEQDDADEDIGEEDEENNPYSLGGDGKD